MKLNKKWLSIPPLLAALIAGQFYYWHYSSLHPSTDDAYVSANVITVASQLNGHIAGVFVEPQSMVKKGQVLFSIKQRPFELALQKAKANLNMVKVDLANKKAALKELQNSLHAAMFNSDVIASQAQRYRILLKKGYTALASSQSLDAKMQAAKQNVNVLSNKIIALKNEIKNEKQAAVSAAQSTVSLARWDLLHTTVRAPHAGIIANLSLQPGDYVAAGKPIFSLIRNHHWWVNAYFKENQLDHIQIGKPVRIRLDMYAHTTFNGKVVSIGAASGDSFSLFPKENASGNWVKVTQRFPVRIRIFPKPGKPLRMGASASVTVLRGHHD